MSATSPTIEQNTTYPGQMNWKDWKGTMLKTVLWSSIAVVTLIQVYPVIFLLTFSLKDNLEIFGGNAFGLPHVFKWENYSRVLENGNIVRYFINSLIVSSGTVILNGILGAMAAYAIARLKWRTSKLTLNLFLLGLMLPMHAALLPIFIVLKEAGLLNTHWALILPNTAFSLPMTIFVLTAFFKEVPNELEEAAVLDGCNPYQVFYYVMLPLVRPALATVSIYAFLFSWNDLLFPVTFISKSEYKTLTVGMLDFAGRYSVDWGAIGAGFMVASLPTILIYVMFSSKIQKGLTAGAVKS